MGAVLYLGSVIKGIRITLSGPERRVSSHHDALHVPKASYWPELAESSKFVGTTLAFNLLPAFSLPSSRTLLEKVLFDTGVKLILIDSSVNFTIFDRTALYDTTVVNISLGQVPTVPENDMPCS